MAAGPDYQVRCERGAAGGGLICGIPFIRRVLLRRNIVIDAETAQLVAAAVQAALQAGAPSRPPRRGPRVPAADCEPLFRPQDAPTPGITSPALSNKAAGPVGRHVGHPKWLVAMLAIRRSQSRSPVRHRIPGVPGSHHPQFTGVLHRDHATVETDGVRTAKAMGLRNLPSKTWQASKGWVLAANIFFVKSSVLNF